MKIDDVLSDIYGNGRFHQLLMVLFAMNMVTFQFSLHFYAFILYKPDGVKCHSADRVLLNNSTAQYFHMAPPSGQNLTDQCLWRDERAKDVLWKCTEWEYPTTFIDRNLVTQENLLCDRAFIRPALESFYLLGIVLGHVAVMLTAGFSRRSVFLGLLTVQGLSNLTMLAANHIFLVGVVMFTQCFTRCIYAICYTQIVELMPIRKRARFGNMFFMSVGLGIIFFSGVAYFMRDWQSIKLCIPLLCLSYPLQLWMFPKSVRHLVMQGKPEEVVQCLAYIARFNNKSSEAEKIILKMEDDVTKLCDQDEEQSPKVKESLLSGFADRSMRKRILLCTVYLGFGKLIKFSLVWHLTFQTENIYLNFFIGGVSDILGIFVPLGLSERYGRRTLCLCFGVFTGLSVMATPLLGHLSWVRFCVGMASKVLNRSLISMSELAAMELFSTSIRHSAFNFTLIYSSSIIVVAPLMRALLSDDGAIQLYAVGMAVVSGMFYFLLPETKGLPLPQTIQDIHPNKLDETEKHEKSLNNAEVNF